MPCLCDNCFSHIQFEHNNILHFSSLDHSTWPDSLTDPKSVELYTCASTPRSLQSYTWPHPIMTLKSSTWLHPFSWHCLPIFGVLPLSNPLLHFHLFASVQMAQPLFWPHPKSRIICLSKPPQIAVAITLVPLPQLFQAIILGSTS